VKNRHSEKRQKEHDATIARRLLVVEKKKERPGDKRKKDENR